MHLWLEKYNLLTFEDIDSTNSEAIRLIKNGARGDHIVLATRQTAGRGRHGRNWISEHGNLYLTLLLDRDLVTENLHQASFVAGLAIWSTITQLAGTEKKHLVNLKWPNDILYEGKKIAGILLENINFQQKNYLVIGVGINIINHPTNLNRPITSLLAEGIIVKDQIQVLNILVNNFDKFFAIWHEQGFSEIRKRWLENAAYIGKIIDINNGIDKATGKFKTIDEQGAIVIEDANGEIIIFNSGEVI